MKPIGSPDLLPVKAPHLPLTAYYRTEEERQAYLKKIFDDTAPDYDRIERLMAFNTGSRYRRQALIRAGLQANMKVLDVGVGTGLVAAQACILTGDPSCVIGVDPSTGMMAASNVPEGMVLMEGRAEALPFPDNHFDFLSMGYALRHISDLSKAFAEFEARIETRRTLVYSGNDQATKRFWHLVTQNLYAWRNTAADTNRCKAKGQQNHLALFLGQHRSLCATRAGDGNSAFRRPDPG